MSTPKGSPLENKERKYKNKWSQWGSTEKSFFLKPTDLGYFKSNIFPKWGFPVESRKCVTVGNKYAREYILKLYVHFFNPLPIKALHVCLCIHSFLSTADLPNNEAEVEFHVLAWQKIEHTCFTLL